ncbi:MAG: non-homologous end-joining DNA ligase [Gaiellaceae bacterium]|jgi:bifunctional non-homologous end joining protein LigD
MVMTGAASRATRLPRLTPMLARASGELPRDERGWAFEFKWDGVRALVYVEGARLSVLSRNGRDVTVAYPELQGLLDAVRAREVVLDGEIVAFDERARPSFGVLQPRMHVTSAARARRLALEIPVAFITFDLLYLDGYSLLDAPYQHRRRSLESLELSGPNWHVPPYFEKDGAELLRVSREQGLEGVVCKRIDSRYLPGRRSDAWLKVKHEKIQEVVVGGWHPGAGRRSGQIGSLLVGTYDGNRLVYAGRVGTGFSENELANLRSLLVPIERPTPPFFGELPRAETSDAHWVEPRLVAEARFSGWTAEGRLRQAVWRGLRSDKRPEEVRREP